MANHEPGSIDPSYGAIARSMDTVLHKIDRLFDAARPEAVFGAPVEAHGRTIIGAAEVLLWAGVGGGGGSGGPTEDEDAPIQVEGQGYGAGAGGGGIAHSRPVAVVIVDSEGVRVEPVVDATKIGLAALTLLGSVAFMLFRMWRGSRHFKG